MEVTSRGKECSLVGYPSVKCMHRGRTSWDACAHPLVSDFIALCTYVHPSAFPENPSLLVNLSRFSPPLRTCLEGACSGTA